MKLTQKQLKGIIVRNLLLEDLTPAERRAAAQRRGQEYLYTDSSGRSVVRALPGIKKTTKAIIPQAWRNFVGWAVDDIVDASPWIKEIGVTAVEITTNIDARGMLAAMDAGNGLLAAEIFGKGFAETIAYAVAGGAGLSLGFKVLGGLHKAATRLYKGYAQVRKKTSKDAPRTWTDSMLETYYSTFGKIAEVKGYSATAKSLKGRRPSVRRKKKKKSEKRKKKYIKNFPKKQAKKNKKSSPDDFELGEPIDTLRLEMTKQGLAAKYKRLGKLYPKLKDSPDKWGKDLQDRFIRDVDYNMEDIIRIIQDYDERHPTYQWATSTMNTYKNAKIAQKARKSRSVASPAPTKKVKKQRSARPSRYAAKPVGSAVPAAVNIKDFRKFADALKQLNDRDVLQFTNGTKAQVKAFADLGTSPRGGDGTRYIGSISKMNVLVNRRTIETMDQLVDYANLSGNPKISWAPYDPKKEVVIFVDYFKDSGRASRKILAIVTR